jgi:hypothetical protein
MCIDSSLETNYLVSSPRRLVVRDLDITDVPLSSPQPARGQLSARYKRGFEEAGPSFGRCI